MFSTQINYAQILTMYFLLNHLGMNSLKIMLLLIFQRPNKYATSHSVYVKLKQYIFMQYFTLKKIIKSSHRYNL